MGALLGTILASSPTPTDIGLDWSAPPGCPSTQDVLGAIDAEAGARPVRAEGVVTGEGTRWSLSLRIEGAGGIDSRTLEGESCEALADAAALLIRVASGPGGREASEPTPATSREPTLQAASATQGGDRASAKSRHSAEVEDRLGEQAPNTAVAHDGEDEPPPSSSVIPLGVHARAVGILQLGDLLPGLAAGGVGIAAGISIPWVRAEVRGTYLAPRQLDDPQNPGVGIRVDGWGVGASGCGVWDGRQVFVPLCVGAQVGRTRAFAFGLEQRGVGRGLWAHGVADLGLGVRVHPRLAVTAATEAVVSLRRPSFRVRGFPTLFQTGPASARLVIGLEVLLRRPPVRGSRG